MDDLTVLIVEDDTKLADIFSITLRSIGLAVECAADGQIALARLAESVPDLVVLDLHLPHTTGPEILAYMRGEARLAHVPVILATADDRLAEDVREQVNILLLKPVSPQQLRLFATRLLDGR